MKIRNVFFDLDGTLSDPAEGIIGCIQHSMAKLNLPCPPAHELTPYIGPPLREGLALICNSSDEVFIEKVVCVFRERFSTVGLFENNMYSDVPQMLGALQSNSYRLFVATSKPTVFAKRIIEHFSIEHHFIDIHGNDLEGTLDDKAEILHELLTKHELVPDETVMVGDRKHDVIAAIRNGVSSLGVTYGYGSKDELTGAGADYVCTSPAEVVSQIMQL